MAETKKTLSDEIRSVNEKYAKLRAARSKVRSDAYAKRKAAIGTTKRKQSEGGSYGLQQLQGFSSSTKTS